MGNLRLFLCVRTTERALCEPFEAVHVHAHISLISCGKHLSWNWWICSETSDLLRRQFVRTHLTYSNRLLHFVHISCRVCQHFELPDVHRYERCDANVYLRILAAINFDLNVHARRWIWKFSNNLYFIEFATGECTSGAHRSRMANRYICDSAYTKKRKRLLNCSMFIAIVQYTLHRFAVPGMSIEFATGPYLAHWSVDIMHIAHDGSAVNWNDSI